MKDQLLKLGFNKTEVDVYLYILSKGRVTPALISKDTGIKRPTVYAAIAELVKQGVVEEDLGGNSKNVMASANTIRNVIASEKQALIEKEGVVNALLPELKKLAYSADNPIPVVQYVRQSDLESFFYKQTPVWNENMLRTRETSWWGYNSNDLTEHAMIRKWITWCWKVSPKVIDLHLFSSRHKGEEEIQKQGYDRRHIKYWDDEYDSSQWILGDYIVMTVTNQKPQYLVQIKDRMMADSLRRTYRKLWHLTK